VLSLGGQIYDPDDPMGKLFFNILATFAEFEVDLIRMLTREGMAVARAQGKLKGRQPKLSPKQQRELKKMRRSTAPSPDQTHRRSVRRRTERRPTSNRDRRPDENQRGSDTEDGSQAFVDVVNQYLGQPAGLLAEE
jgi:DNA invertase Pin-like site-specific DNA recombinase